MIAFMSAIEPEAPFYIIGFVELLLGGYFCNPKTTACFNDKLGLH